MKKKQRVIMEHGNKTRKYYPAEIHDISPTYKSHRIPVPEETQKLADSLNRLIKLFNLTFGQVNSIVYKEFGQGFGRQQFMDHFLDKIHGVGFNPRDKTLVKYRFLEQTLSKKEKQFAKSK